MRVLDLFAGLGGWSACWAEAGHEVVTLDIDPRFGCTITTDILAPFDLPWRPDVILASPPCETFSVASIGAHWTGGRRAYQPKTAEAERGMRIARRTVDLIDRIRPEVAVIENPRGVLRNLGIIPAEPVTVWQCHYGREIAKPTDLWGLPFPSAWEPEPVCHNRRPDHPGSCCCHDHEAAPRGAKTGTQGIDGAAGRAEIPAGLAKSNHGGGDGMRKRRPYGMALRERPKPPKADPTPSICAGCFDPIDPTAVARAIARRERYAHGCGRTLVDPAYLPPVGGP